MPFPDFMVIGAMKAGTTSLWEYLRAHPRLYMAEPKELHFFSRHWDRGVDWYRSCFAPAAEDQLRGEASTTYTMHPRYVDVAARIHATVPEVKLVYLLRDPVARIESHYRDDVTKGLERRPIDEAIRHNPNYIDFSRYGAQLDQYLAHFTSDRVLLLGSDALRADPQQTLDRLFRFLGAEPQEGGPETTEVHRTADKVVRRGWARRLRRLPGYDKVASKAPRALRRLNYRLTTRSGRAVAARLSEPSRELVRTELGPDWEALRRYAPDLVARWEAAGS